jgi:hypothetical protein
MSGEATEPSDEELRAAWEEQLRLLTPADVIAQALVSLVTLAGRRIGLAPGGEQERDLAQVRDAIDAARALLPILERGEDGGQRWRGCSRCACGARRARRARGAGAAGWRRGRARTGPAQRPALGPRLVSLRSRCLAR